MGENFEQTRIDTSKGPDDYKVNLVGGPITSPFGYIYGHYNDRENDVVNHPKHYKAPNGIETIDVIEGFTDPITWNMGNVIKYICRWRNKNGLEDLQKAQFYLNRLIKVVEEKYEKGETVE